jgi:hypothetical protein
VPNQIGLCRCSFSSGTLRGTDADSPETRPYTDVVTVPDDRRPSEPYRGFAANETQHKTEQRLPLTTRWAILRKQFLRRV